MIEFRPIPIAKLAMNTGQIEGLPANPRQWTQDDLDKLCKSIEETPELLDARGAIVVPHKGKYIVLGGNMRVTAARKLGLKEVPCAIVPEDTPADKLRQIVIKDNGIFGAWDFDALANEWDNEPLTDWGVPAWKPDPYSPNLDPVDGAKPVTDADIEAAEGRIGDEVTPTEKTLVEVTCPHCGKTFSVKL